MCQENLKNDIGRPEISGPANMEFFIGRRQAADMGLDASAAEEVYWRKPLLARSRWRRELVSSRISWRMFT